jgi:hypothetical protein
MPGAGDSASVDPPPDGELGDRVALGVVPGGADSIPQAELSKAIPRKRVAATEHTASEWLRDDLDVVVIRRLSRRLPRRCNEATGGLWTDNNPQPARCLSAES